jgi:acyl carrier protein phosphodiesterase
MNFLAHIYLSGDNEHIRIGNFMADGIRGKQFEAYPPDVQKGIMLHRMIDTFTDNHDVFRQTTRRLHPAYHHYAGVIADMFYDHFLAANWHLYSNISLPEFIAGFYQSLHRHYDILSDKTKQLMVPMIQYNWLLSYQTIEGLGRILGQMDRRTGNRSGMSKAVNELQIHYQPIKLEFTEFFEDLRQHAAQQLITL